MCKTGLHLLCKVRLLPFQVKQVQGQQQFAALERVAQ